MEWANDKGASVYTHWFQPMGSTEVRLGMSGQVHNGEPPPFYPPCRAVRAKPVSKAALPAVMAHATYSQEAEARGVRARTVVGSAHARGGREAECQRRHALAPGASIGARGGARAVRDDAVAHSKAHRRPIDRAGEHGEHPRKLVRRWR